MKNNIIKNHALLRDIIALEPTNIKNVVLNKKQWEVFRPVIKTLQKLGLWYDISEHYTDLYIRVKVNDIIEKYLQSILDNIA